MVRTGRWVTLFLLLAAGAVGALFTIQNSTRLSDLSLDLWVIAYHLKEPQPIPVMLWAAFAAGLLLAGTWGSFQRMSLQRRVRDLEQEVARSSLQAREDDWT